MEKNLIITTIIGNDPINIIATCVSFISVAGLIFLGYVVYLIW